MKNTKQVIKYLKILGINSTDSFYDGCVNDFHNKQFSKVLNSKITKEENKNERRRFELCILSCRGNPQG